MPSVHLPTLGVTLLIVAIVFVVYHLTLARR